MSDVNGSAAAAAAAVGGPTERGRRRSRSPSQSGSGSDGSRASGSPPRARKPREERSRSRSRSPRRRRDDKERSSKSRSRSPKRKSERSHRHKRKHHRRSRSRSSSRSRSGSRDRQKSSSSSRRSHSHKSHHRRSHKRKLPRDDPAAGITESEPVGAGAVDQNKYGSRGLLNQTHFFEKAKEFQVWLAEVKGISPDASVPRGEMMEMFRDYVEDYNTCTLAHEKYYDLERYETNERARAAAGGAAAGKGGGGGRDAGSFDMLKEQQALKREAEAAKKNADLARIAMYYTSMGDERKAAIKSQQELTLRMQYAYKSGNFVEAERIKKQLEPEK